MGILSWFERSRPDADEDDVREEIRSHLAIAIEERMADGADPQTARYAALREFGNVTLTTEAIRGVWTPRWLEAVREYAGDLRYAVRALAKEAAFSTTVVGVLALGIGLNAAVFTMLKGLALAPLAGVARSGELAVISSETSTGRQVRVSYPDYRYLRDHDRAFSGLFGSAVATLGLGRGRSARQIWGELVTGNYFQVLDVHAQIGRTLLPSDEVAPGRHPVIVLSDGLWRRDFEADPDVVGKTVLVNNHVLTVVGVADPTFHGTVVSYDVEVFIPVMTAPRLGFTFGSQQATPSGILADHRAAVFFPQGYLRPGTTLAHAAAQADGLWAALARDRPLTDAAQHLRVVPFWQAPGSGPTYALPAVSVLGAMGLFVLMIACANIAGLVLVRGVSRRGEIAVRLALGAAPTRIVRLLVIENLVLAVAAAVLGLLLARYGIVVLVGYAERLAAPQRIFFNTEIDGLIMGFALLVGCGSALLFGFVPALHSSRVALVSVITDDASPRTASRRRLRSILVVAQVAVSLLLLVGAGLAARSVEAARRSDPGFDASQVTAVALNLRQSGYDRWQGRTFYRDLLEAARAGPDIESATLAAHVPLSLHETRPERIAIERYEPDRDEDLVFMSNIVAPDYFRTLRISLTAGREFEEADDESAAPVAIVNNTLAQRFWGAAADAIGKRLRVGDGDWRTVIGVASDVKYARIDEAPRPYVYLPFLQSYRGSMVLHTRGRGAVDRLVEQARASVAALDADLPILSAKPLADETRGALIFFDLIATMLSVFGAAGMGLAAVGIYGLVSYTVAQSAHEIGIRMVLGASGVSIVREFLARGLRLGAAGAALGLVAALGASRLLGSFLFGVSPTDGTSFFRALAIVVGGVIIAAIVPAWRASRTNPLSALRHQ